MDALRAGKHVLMSANPIETYLTTLAETRGTRANVAETSFYPALEQLLTEIGKTLNPRVRCVIHISGHGAGIPDGGLFTADQFRRQSRDSAAASLCASAPLRENHSTDNPILVQNPNRGVIEAKPPRDDLDAIVGSEQVERYWQRFGMVLVTNFRAFALVGKGPENQPRVLEAFTLAESESAFWALAAHPRKTADEYGARMLEYLKRVLLHNAPLASPQDVAALLASYAHDARIRVERADLPALTSLRQALEEALGLQFEGEKGEHFFRSTLVQTLFYGVFSAWVLWSRQRAAKPSGKKTAFAAAIHETPAPYAVAGAFDWKSAHHLLRVPMLRALFVQVADPARLGALGLIEVLDWSAAALNRVDRVEFFKSFDEGHAVQYFYEPFLCAFDPALRKELGVWYTPEEIVRYQVERVDAVLRSELGLADGLADPQVVVLDPCCGTGAYLRAVLRRIAATLREKGGDALVAYDLKRAAMERVFGFEILPAPFVIAHLQLGLELETLGAPLSDRTDPPERAGVYLTNALTGWEPPKEPKTRVLFPEMEEERDAAEHVKQSPRILVIIGNPPYNGFAGVAVKEERDLSNAYRTTRRASAPQGQGLNDLYIRFFRMAERRITEMNRPAQGVICFISNYSWLDGLSFTGMRERFIETFDRISIDCLNGDKYKTGKLTPEGKPDPSVFSTEFNREGIQVGTAIALLVKVAAGSPLPAAEVSTNAGQDPAAGKGLPAATVNSARALPAIHFRHLWGITKRADLLTDEGRYADITPELGMGYSLMPGQVSSTYLNWPLLPQLFPVSFPGVKTSRDNFLVDADRNQLLARLKEYFNPDISHAEMRQINPGVMEDTARFKGEIVRDTLRKRGFLPNNIVRYCYRPFDVRWLYWEPETKLLDEKRSEYFPHVIGGNLALVSQQKPRRDWSQPQLIGPIGCLDLMDRGASCFPLFLHADGASLLETAGKRPNLNETATAYLSDLHATPEDLFYHALAVLHTPAYRTENAGALRQDWPRIPLPGFTDVTKVEAASRRFPVESPQTSTKVEAASRRFLVESLQTSTKVEAASRRFLVSALQTSAALGRQVAALLDTETPVPGVTSGKIRDDLRRIAIFERLDGKPANPDHGDFDLTAGWGHAGKGGVCMPGRGRVVPAVASEQLAVSSGGSQPRTKNEEPRTASALAVTSEQSAVISESTKNEEPRTKNGIVPAYDVYLNEFACWRHIPEPVWDYTIGGYQVLKKWLSYREKPILCRGLNRAEVQHVTDTARRLTALIALQPALDANYRAVAGFP